MKTIAGILQLALWVIGLPSLIVIGLIEAGLKITTKIVTLVLLILFLFVTPFALLFAGVAGMTPAEMWKVLKVILRANSAQIIGHKIYEIGAEHAEDSSKDHKTDGVVVEILATRQDFENIRDQANEQLLWFSNMTFRSLGTTEKFIYSFYLVNLQLDKWKRRK